MLCMRPLACWPSGAAHGLGAEAPEAPEAPAGRPSARESERALPKMAACSVAQPNGKYTANSQPQRNY